jgi:RimJ/RimL family protein N-acetyltransferase
LDDQDTIELTHASSHEIVSNITINKTSIEIILTTSPDPNTNIFIMMLPQEHFKKILEITPKFQEYYYDLADNAFINEWDYKKGDLKKTIENTETENNHSFTNIINIYFDSQSYDIVTCVFADTHTNPTVEEKIPSVYFWSLFTNPKYYRQGFAESMIKLITMFNIRIASRVEEEEAVTPIFTSLIYVWNTASINLFTKLGYKCFRAFSSLPTTESENKDQSTLKKYIYDGVEYDEKVELAFIYNPTEKLNDKIATLQVDLEKLTEYENIEKVS